jgi:hypothetical protein
MTPPRIQAIVNQFIADLSQALAEEGSAAIAAALGTLGGGEVPAPFGAGAKKRGPGRPKGSVGAPKTKARAKGAKRTPEELEALTKSLLGVIRKSPGSRIEEIAATLEVPTKELQLPTIKLLEAKAISKKGQKRATVYYPKG